MYDVYYTYFGGHIVHHDIMSLKQLIDFFNLSFNRNVFSHFYIDFNFDKEGELICFDSLKRTH